MWVKLMLLCSMMKVDEVFVGLWMEGGVCKYGDRVIKRKEMIGCWGSDC